MAIQAQVMSAAELTLNARIEDLRRDDIRDALWTHRTLVKTWAMRGTLHLVAADELPELVGALANRESWRSEAWLRYWIAVNASTGTREDTARWHSGVRARAAAGSEVARSVLDSVTVRDRTMAQLDSAASPKDASALPSSYSSSPALCAA